MKVFYRTVLGLFAVIIQFTLQHSAQAIPLTSSSNESTIILKLNVDGKKLSQENRTAESLRIKIENFKFDKSIDAKILVEVIEKSGKERVISSALFELKRDYINDVATIPLKKFNVRKVKELRIYISPDINILNVTCAELEDGAITQCGIPVRTSRAVSARAKNKVSFRVMALDRENMLPVTLAKILFVSKGKRLKGSTDVYGISEKFFKKNTLVAASIEKKGYVITSTKAFKLKSDKVAQVLLVPNGQQRDTPVPTPGQDPGPGPGPSPVPTQQPPVPTQPQPVFTQIPVATYTPTRTPTFTPTIMPLTVLPLQPTYNVSDGSFVTLTCIANSTSSAAITYQWINIDGGIVSTEQNYTFVVSKWLHGAKYRCRALQGAYYADTNFTTINVLYKPIITDFSLSPNIGAAGSYTTLSVTYQSNPAATVRYYKNNVEIFPDQNGRYRIEFGDSGAMFHVVVTNSVGSTESDRKPFYVVSV